jgi:hypothetical protein
MLLLITEEMKQLRAHVGKDYTYLINVPQITNQLASQVITEMNQLCPTIPKRLAIYGGVNEPRLSTFFAMDGHSLAYSGIVHQVFHCCHFSTSCITFCKLIL